VAGRAGRRAAAAACLLALLAAGCGGHGADHLHGKTQAAVAEISPGPCDLHATPATFASQVAAARAGQTVCLGAGDYGTWTGTNKAIVVAPEPGVSPTMSFDFGRDASGFTVYGGHTNYDSNSPGINMGPSSFDPGSRDITIENVAARANAAFFVFDIRTDGPGIVIRNNVFHDMLFPNTTSGAVRILPPDMVPSSNIVVEYNLFRDMGADGIDGGPGTILGNDFANVDSEKQPQDPRHTDVIQMGNGPDVIRGNFVHDGCIQGIDAFDGTASNVIEENVIVGCSVHSLVLAGDTPGSTVDHNTVLGNPNSALLECGSKPGEGPSVTEILNNILQAGVGSSGVPCQPSEVTHNLFYPGTSATALNGAGNLTGTPRFVGGADPNTYGGYGLAARSPGTGAATDVGARVNRYPRERALDAQH
jgi:hypothetical protein